MKPFFQFSCCFLLVGVFTFFVPSAVNLARSSDSTLRTFSSGNFKRYTIKKEERQLYFTIQGAAASRRLTAAMRSAFTNYGFALSASPSAADVIVQITIAYAGRASERDIERAVASGYDGRVAVTGKSVFGLVADILLVARAVPMAKDETQLKLKNISQRLALASSTIRLGCVGSQANQLSASFAEQFAKRVSGKVMQAVAPGR